MDLAVILEPARQSTHPARRVQIGRDRIGLCVVQMRARTHVSANHKPRPPSATTANRPGGQPRARASAFTCEFAAVP
jgi:hypothetical protein